MESKESLVRKLVESTRPEDRSTSEYVFRRAMYEATLEVRDLLVSLLARK